MIKQQGDLVLVVRCQQSRNYSGVQVDMEVAGMGFLTTSFGERSNFQNLEGIFD